MAYDTKLEPQGTMKVNQEKIWFIAQIIAAILHEHRLLPKSLRKFYF